MTDHIEKLTELIPDGDGYNSDYAHTLLNAIEYIKQLEEVNSNKSDLIDSLCVGDYEIRTEGNLIFIRHSSSESGGFNPILFEKCIDRFFNENF